VDWLVASYLGVGRSAAADTGDADDLIALLGGVPGFSQRNS